MMVVGVVLGLDISDADVFVCMMIVVDLVVSVRVDAFADDCDHDADANNRYKFFGDGQ